MTQEKLEELHEVIVKMRTLAEADVMRHDRGPEQEPSDELLRAVAVTKLATDALRLLEAERLAMTGEVRWLDWGF